MPLLAVTRVLPYPREELFDLAADVERYPEFLPWWLSARIVRRDGAAYYTDQVVGIGPIRRQFGSKTVLRRPDEIEVTSVDGQFDAFHLLWRFGLLPRGECKVALSGELAVRAPLLADLFGRLVVEGADAILRAFEERARDILGSSSREAP